MDTSKLNETWSCCGDQAPEQEIATLAEITETEFYLNKEANAQERIAICESCPHLKALNRCDQCGCFVNIKARIFFAHCPLKKW